jgi:hypothetical protein
LIILHALTESKTPHKDQIIHFLALVIFSSSPEARRNIIPEIMREITATTATYLIHSAITLERN